MTEREIQIAAINVTADLLADGDIPEIQHVQDINDGWCLHFAEQVRDRVGGDVEVYEHVGYGWAHCWVECDGRAYDAEAPAGVDDWRELPFSQRHPSMQETGESGPTEVTA